MIDYIETHITEACNLKCRGCSHFSVFAKPKHKDLEDFRKEFARLSDITDIGTIRLMGGEPLLNPRFMDYCFIARNFFPNSKIALVTNGLLGERLVPHEDELEQLRINVTISDYHLDKQKSSMQYTERHDKGWLYNISLDMNGKQDMDKSFKNCDLHQGKWYFLKDGRLYPCCVAGTIQDFWNHFGLDWGIDQKSLSIDIFTHTEKEIEAFLQNPCELCRYCDTEKRKHSYKPFEQSKGDINEWLR